MSWYTIGKQLWEDELGAVISTEYLMLGSIVVLGGATGLSAMRDAAVDEMKEYGRSVRTVNQSYSYPSASNKLASRGGGAAVDTPPKPVEQFSP